jgi:hypothetical protein
MNKVLLSACGVLNAVFTVFHIYLGLVIHRLPSLAPGYRALMEALNLGGILMIGFLAFAYLACQAEIRGRLGRGVSLLGALLYLTRALEEYLIFPAQNPYIIVICIVAGLLHLAALRPVRVAVAASPGGVGPAP